MSDYKNGVCKWCGDRGEVYSDNGFCERCDSDTVFCHICQERISRENKCRHVFQGDDSSEWHGSGIGIDLERDRKVKKSFFELARLMPPDFAIDLRTAILSEQFYTWIIAPLIGSGGILEMHGMPNRDGKSMFLEYGDRMLEIGSSEKSEEISMAYGWLASLFKENTSDANIETVDWIEEWLWLSHDEMGVTHR